VCDWQARIKVEAYDKVVACPLVRGCAAGGDYPRALFGGFWHFVDAFPGIIRDTYANFPVGPLGHSLRVYLRRVAPLLSETLGGMAGEERGHRALWIRSASRVGLSAAQLRDWRVLPEISFLTEAIRSEEHLARRLLYFVGVELVAEGIARYLYRAPRFVEAMGEEGMEWFTAHLIHPDGAISHEVLAYRLSLSVKRAARESADEQSVNADIQRCVDWFFAGGVACAREANYPGGAG